MANLRLYIKRGSPEFNSIVEKSLSQATNEEIRNFMFRGTYFKYDALEEAFYLETQLETFHALPTWMSPVAAWLGTVTVVEEFPNTPHRVLGHYRTNDRVVTATINHYREGVVRLFIRSSYDCVLVVLDAVQSQHLLMRTGKCIVLTSFEDEQVLPEDIS